MTPPKHIIRLPPTPEMLARQQQSAADLIKLSAWSEEPTAKTPFDSVEPPKKPWDIPNPESKHPYHVILPEGLFQQMSFIWKRLGHSSMREWMVFVLEEEADKALRRLGEKQ
jgi:hypothetical protein